MDTIKFLTPIFIASILLASTPVFAGKIAFESAVKVKRGDQLTFDEIKAGEEFEIKSGDQLLVISKQGLPILVFAPASKDSSIIIQDGAVSAALQEQLQPALDKSTSEIIEGLRKAESFIQKRDYSQASIVTTGLKSKYKNNSSILFLNGTVSYLMNNKSAAIEDLQKGLAIDPNNESAKKLLAQLKGGT